MNAKETGRVEAFSDGVFAIAITLLVLDLRIPESETRPLAQVLASMWPVYAAYLVSFLFILIMWINHHRMFEAISRIDNTFLLLNGFLLLGVTVVPFPTSLVSRYILTDDQTTATAVYTGWFLLIAILFNVMWRYAYRQHGLVGAQARAEQMASAITARYRWGIPSYFVAFLLAFVWPPAALAMSLGLAIYYAVPGDVSLSLSSLRRRA